MKKQIIILFVSLVICSQSFAQFSPDPDINKFIGTWKWGNGQDSVIMVFQKQVVNYTSTISAERIIGWHKYVKNGQVLENSLPYVGSNYNNEYNNGNIHNTILGGPEKVDQIRFYFYDLTNNRDQTAICKLLPNSTTQLTCHLRTSHELWIKPFTLYTLPQDFVLIKQ